jgi:hypothetical protein
MVKVAARLSGVHKVEMHREKLHICSAWLRSLAIANNVSI